MSELLQVAETPEEIALAIVAEVQAVRAGRRAAPLRERPGALHDGSLGERPWSESPSLRS
jgi:xanthine dehydrogenase accessory factor